MVAPYLSVVVAARNDDHGGNMLARMQAFADSWIQQAEQFGLPSEVLVVEWNPPSDRVSLAKAVNWPRNQYCRVRVITVPAEIHEQFPNSTVIPLHQMIAKNVGIRRSTGRSVLATNLDVIFSSELMQFLASADLQHDAMYRIDRYDVPPSVLTVRTVQHLLESCRSNVHRVHSREGSFELSPDGDRKPPQDDIVSANSGIRLHQGWYSPETYGEGTFRWMGSPAEIEFERAPGPRLKLRIDLEVGPSGGSEVRLEILDLAGTILASADIVGHRQIVLHIPADFAQTAIRLYVRGSNLPIDCDPRLLNMRVFSIDWGKPDEELDFAGPDLWRFEACAEQPGTSWDNSAQAPSPFAEQAANPAYLHANAAGDFTLLSRDNWFNIRGYAEFPIWPMHIDSLFCYAAYHAGMREIVLQDQMRIYHVEHSSAAGWSPEGEGERAARVAAKKVDAVEYQDFVRWIAQMRRFSAPIIFNKENWGLADQVLSEVTL